MHDAPAAPPPRIHSRFSLSARGHATEAMCPESAYVTAEDGSWDRKSSERAQWAYTHGLEPMDGAYLRELRRRLLTLSQLGEALAIYGQSSEMVGEAMDRLLSLGLVIKDEIRPDIAAPVAIDAELTAALEDLQLLLENVETAGVLDGRTASVALRRAMSRVIAARRYTQRA